MKRGPRWSLVLAVVGVLVGPAAGAVTMELVTVGDPGNVGELAGANAHPESAGPDRICGAVGYTYQIGKYEVTNAQYRTFLNSVARYGDPYELYSPYGDEEGIVRGGAGTAADPYTYTLTNNDPNWANRPVTTASWYSALRFVNWLQNGQPLAEAGAGVTETGTYTFGGGSVITIQDVFPITFTYYPVTVPDHAALGTPTWVLPTEDEWYKAAYYKGGGTDAGYWDYATQSDTLPDNNPPELDTGNSVNYALSDQDPNTSDYALGWPVVYGTSEVGAYALSGSAYDTYDQNGNTSEWVEGFLSYELQKQIRGGGWRSSQWKLPAWRRYTSLVPDSPWAGFRIALVPEPTALCLLAVGLAGICMKRRRR